MELNTKLKEQDK